jgi:LCCL domain
MKVIQELIAYFDRRGKLTKKQMDKLLKQGLLAVDAPDSMVALCKQIGKTFYLRVHGEEHGSIWGTDIYTGDSALGPAVVHAGAVELGETAVVKVTIVEPQSQYHGSTRNGITSYSYGPFGASYRVDLV